MVLARGRLKKLYKSKIRSAAPFVFGEKSNTSSETHPRASMRVDRYTGMFKAKARFWTIGKLVCVPIIGISLPSGNGSGCLGSESGCSGSGSRYGGLGHKPGSGALPDTVYSTLPMSHPGAATGTTHNKLRFWGAQP